MAVMAAEAIVKPFPADDVVSSGASRYSVIFMVSGSSPAISDMLCALPAIWLKVYTVTLTPMVASIPTAERPIPYIPDDMYPINIAAQIHKIGIYVESIPVARPAIITVADPVLLRLAICLA